MHKVGVMPGKLLPLHRGHIHAILTAATKCETLYVVVGHNHNEVKELTKHTKYMPLNERVKWVAQEFSNMPHIKVVGMSEDNYGIDMFPNGWEKWAKVLQEIIPEPIDVIFGNEESYRENHKKYMPHIEYETFDVDRSIFNTSGTEIRENPIKHWDMLSGAARPFFAKKILITGTESCVDSETEFFNGFKWKKISEYREEDFVLQYNADGTSELVKPLRYIKEKTDKLYIMQNSCKTWSQVYSNDHDLVYITSKGNLAKKKFEDVKKAHFENTSGFQGKFLTSFNFNSKLELGITEAELRLWIAISADGTISKNNWRIRLKKERKIERLRKLIRECNLEIDERIYADGYSNFYVPISFGTKIFPQNFYLLSEKEREIFIEEIFFWDGNLKDNRYFSTEIENAKIVQFIIAASGYKTLWHEDIRDDKKICYSVEKSSVKYLSISINLKTNGQYREEMIKEFVPKDGHKYCFTVPSGMLVLRRDNHIFVTGNCGKTTLTKALAKTFYTSWSEEVGRYYSERYLGGREDGFSVEDFDRIAWLQYEQDREALRTANKMVFFDTDALITDFYCVQYLGVHSDFLIEFAKRQQYDLIIVMKPDVKWVADGQRWISDQKERETNHAIICDMYRKHKPNTPLIEVGGNYTERLNTIYNALQCWR